MNDPKELFQRAADLAHMGWTEGDAEALESQVKAVLEAFQIISDLDVGDVPPTLGATLLEDIKRQDTPRPSDLARGLLEGAPRSQGTSFVVPRAIEADEGEAGPQGTPERP